MAYGTSGRARVCASHLIEIDVLHEAVCIPQRVQLVVRIIALDIR